MAITQSGRMQGGKLQGANGKITQHGVLVFTSTDADGELPLNMQVLESFSYVWIGTPAADEVLSIDEAESNGHIKVPASGSITLKRTGAAKTSGLKLMYWAVGF